MYPGISTPRRHDRRAVTPTGIERPYSRDEIIVSKTDRQGRITYANDIFCRVAAFDEADLLGQPHSIVRHPDMPRAVFQVLWDRLGAGKEIFAYVLNMAKDGGHYWVLAHVTPTLDARGQVVGHHSSRRWVPPHVRATVAEVYATVLEAESRAASTPEKVAAGLACLDDLLDAAGHTLDTWVWSLAAREEVYA